MSFIKHCIAFFKSKWFLINVIGAILVVSAGLYGIMSYLDSYTQHNSKLSVPDFNGYRLSDLDEVFEENHLRYQLIDSMYDPTREKGVVIDQLPEPGEEVKENRTIYLTINAQKPPMIKMPNLVNMSKRQAMSVLEIVGLKVKRFEYKPDICTDCVLEQKYDDKVIEPGDLIFKGERLTLVLGEGRSGGRTSIPYLKRLSFEDTKNLLHSYSLELGVSIYEDCKTADDSANARVYRQMPEYIPNGRISYGSEVDIWLSPDTLKSIDE